MIKKTRNDKNIYGNVNKNIYEVMIFVNLFMLILFLYL